MPPIINGQRRLDPELILHESYTRTINGHDVTFNEVGFHRKGPAIVALSDWGMSIREFNRCVTLLMQHYRIITVCFPGHGVNRDPVPDFTYEQHAFDVLGLLDWLGVPQFVCLSSGQSCWTALDLAEMVGRERMIGLFLCEALMTQPSDQLRSILADMQSLQPHVWRPAVDAYHADYKDGGFLGPLNAGYVDRHREIYMGGIGQDTWARAGRYTEEAYARWGSPMQRLEAMLDPPLVFHFYGHPSSKEYEALHKSFKSKHAEWFSYRKKSCNTRCPHIEHETGLSLDMVQLITKATAREPPEFGLPKYHHTEKEDLSEKKDLCEKQ